MRGKRVLDLLGSSLGLALLWPLLLLIAALVKAEDGGPVFFRQTRVGYRGRLFRIWKFRTMTPDAEARGGMLTVGNDPRMTRVGMWLRRFKLDELPQLLNVLVGEMSLVGPRPELAAYVAMYTTEQRRVLDLKPGITGAASICYRNESEVLARAADPERFYVEVIMPDKIQLGLAYGARSTVWTDLVVVARTLRNLLRRPMPPSGMEIGGMIRALCVVIAASLLLPPVAAGAQRAAEPPLTPGDALRLTVWRHPELSGEFTIAGDSTLIHPLYQRVKVAGVPLALAKERLRGFLATYETDVQLVLEPLFPVTVGGEIRTPNLYRLPQGTTIAQAVALAGGPTERGRLDRVRVVRRQSELMLDLTSDYARSEKVLLSSGDQILVGRRSDFNVLRDLVFPLTSVTAAVASIISISRQ